MKRNRERILERVRQLPPEGQDRFYSFAFDLQRKKEKGTLLGLVIGAAIGIAMAVYVLVVG
jgi:hypothetical protein